MHQQVILAAALLAILFWALRGPSRTTNKRAAAGDEDEFRRSVPDLWSLRESLRSTGSKNAERVGAKIERFVRNTVRCIGAPKDSVASVEALGALGALRDDCIDSLQALGIDRGSAKAARVADNGMERFVVGSERYLAMAWRAAGSPNAYLAAARGFPSPWDTAKRDDYNVAV